MPAHDFTSTVASSTVAEDRMNAAPKKKVPKHMRDFPVAAPLLRLEDSMTPRSYLYWITPYAKG